MCTYLAHWHKQFMKRASLAANLKLQILHAGPQHMPQLRRISPVLQEHIEAGNDRLCAQIKEITTAESRMQISPAEANVTVNSKIRKGSESEVGGELAEVA